MTTKTATLEGVKTPKQSDETYERLMRGPLARVEASLYWQTGPGKAKLDDSLVKPLVEAGLNGQQIVDVLRHRHGIETTRAGVSYWRKVRGYPVKTRSANTEALVPWRVLIKDESHRLLKALRTEARLRDGFKPARNDIQRLHSVVAEMRELGGMVVYYDQTNGFRLVEPRPGIDTDMIYDPRFRDDGSSQPDKGLWQ